MNIQTITEGWLTFKRVNCTEGYIDHWTGDSANNPNNPEKHNQSLNSFSDYFRLNNGEWVHRLDLKKGTDVFRIAEYSELFTAEEIWISLQRFDIDYIHQTLSAAIKQNYDTGNCCENHRFFKIKDNLEPPL